MSAATVKCSFRLTVRQALAVLWQTVRGLHITLSLEADSITVTRSAP